MLLRARVIPGVILACACIAASSASVLVNQAVLLHGTLSVDPLGSPSLTDGRCSVSLSASTVALAASGQQDEAAAVRQTVDVADSPREQAYHLILPLPTAYLTQSSADAPVSDLFTLIISLHAIWACSAGPGPDATIASRSWVIKPDGFLARHDFRAPDDLQTVPWDPPPCPDCPACSPCLLPNTAAELHSPSARQHPDTDMARKEAAADAARAADAAPSRDGVEESEPQPHFAAASHTDIAAELSNQTGHKGYHEASCPCRDPAVGDSADDHDAAPVAAPTAAAACPAAHDGTNFCIPAPTQPDWLVAMLGRITSDTTATHGQLVVRGLTLMHWCNNTATATDTAAGGLPQHTSASTPRLVCIPWAVVCVTAALLSSIATLTLTTVALCTMCRGAAGTAPHGRGAHRAARQQPLQRAADAAGEPAGAAGAGLHAAAHGAPTISHAQQGHIPGGAAAPSDTRWRHLADEDPHTTQGAANPLHNPHANAPGSRIRASLGALGATLRRISGAAGAGRDMGTGYVGDIGEMGQDGRVGAGQWARDEDGRLRRRMSVTAAIASAVRNSAGVVALLAPPQRAADDTDGQ